MFGCGRERNPHRRRPGSPEGGRVRRIPDWRIANENGASGKGVAQSAGGSKERRWGKLIFPESSWLKACFYDLGENLRYYEFGRCAGRGECWCERTRVHLLRKEPALCRAADRAGGDCQAAAES